MIWLQPFERRHFLQIAGHTLMLPFLPSLVRHAEAAQGEKRFIWISSLGGGISAGDGIWHRNGSNYHRVGTGMVEPRRRINVISKSIPGISYPVTVGDLTAVNGHYSEAMAQSVFGNHGFFVLDGPSSVTVHGHGPNIGPLYGVAGRSLGNDAGWSTREIADATLPHGQNGTFHGAHPNMTFDAELASKLPRNTPIQHLVAVNHTIQPSDSFYQQNGKIERNTNPYRAAHTLYAAVFQACQNAGGSSGAAPPRVIPDEVLAYGNSLRALYRNRLSTADNRKLDQYFTEIFDLKNRLGQGGSLNLDCRTLARPPASRTKQEDLEHIIRIISFALTWNLTRVATFGLSELPGTQFGAWHTWSHSAERDPSQPGPNMYTLLNGSGGQSGLKQTLFNTVMAGFLRHLDVPDPTAASGVKVIDNVAGLIAGEYSASHDSACSVWIGFGGVWGLNRNQKRHIDMRAPATFRCSGTQNNWLDNNANTPPGGANSVGSFRLPGPPHYRFLHYLAQRYGISLDTRNRTSLNTSSEVRINGRGGMGWWSPRMIEVFNRIGVMPDQHTPIDMSQFF